MTRSSIKIALFLTSAPVMVATALAWGSPAMAVQVAPAPLPVIGALSALGFSRALRQRIQKHQANTNQLG
jgi:hypothetical protein